MSEPKLIITCIPSLVSVLLRYETEKGSPLNKEEVQHISDNAAAIALPLDVALAVEKERGYKDIPGINCWEEWQEARMGLT